MGGILQRENRTGLVWFTVLSRCGLFFLREGCKKEGKLASEPYRLKHGFVFYDAGNEGLNGKSKGVLMQKKGLFIGRVVVFMLLGAILAGCSSTPDMPKGKKKGYSTVRFIKAKKSDAFQLANEETNEMLQQSISSELKRQGLDMVDANSDLIVAYLIILQNNVATTSINEHFGYMGDANALVELAHEKGMEGRYPEFVKKGALVIDLIDAKTNKLIYRDFAARGIDTSLSDEARRAKLDGVVKETLAAFFR